MIEALRELGGYIEQKRSDCVISWDTDSDELNIMVAPSNIASFVDFLKCDSRCKFSTLVDITGVDFPERVKRFEVVYHLLSMYQNHRVRLKVSIRENEPIQSIISVHPSANWFEREVFDMFGILFQDHPDLRRILTDYGFQGFPLRKDFPTTGYNEVRYDEAQKRVVYEPVNLTQEYRQFDFKSPWEGAEYIMPDDETEGAT